MNRLVPAGTVDRVRRDRQMNVVRDIQRLARAGAVDDDALLHELHRAAREGRLTAFAAALQAVLIEP